jgi:two-component system, chemotaxis family, response regulator Rcp1
LKKSQKRTNLSVASNGEEGLAFLHRQGNYVGAVRPDLILLDLGMPRKDGHAVLTEIKKDPALICIPVIVFSSSDAESDVLKSYELGASCYVKKPSQLTKFNEVVESIVQFWLTTVRLPRNRTLLE